MKKQFIDTWDEGLVNVDFIVEILSEYFAAGDTIPGESVPLENDTARATAILTSGKTVCLGFWRDVYRPAPTPTDPTNEVLKFSAGDMQDDYFETLKRELNGSGEETE